ncbi:indole-3-glycerol phosphate synthase TrpC [Tichowtungia aerotolerans]|uniref:Indole-3-glycerol phosphate synthase n=1 Tax=Tichowtungia aerotolerans TaxID=2697043 RepID=A0A6P1M4U1_9BACT|nr:indole-3-glycerol phosphate synthase TrpC [Tichowtungia aerotolerans]QHI68857.1 indole-3-glycerol phosphate synthase TrpC [Tichowtungia aerotolerans]
MDILSEIVANKRVEIEQPDYFQTLEKVVDELPHVGNTCDACDGKPARAATPDFIEALTSAPMGLIAEVKRQSPSAGAIRVPFEPAEIAKAYEAAGAQVVSCLMDKKYFGGGEDQWAAVRAATKLPMLYKEFVIDPRQIFHAEALGASAVLLIVAVLTDEELTSFIHLVQACGMTPLVEVHTEEEMKRAVAANAKCIGINNRNLKTFETKIETTLALRELAPADCTLISESGIRTADDIRTLKDAGIAAVLVGESLLRQPDLEQAVKDLMAV